MSTTAIDNAKKRAKQALAIAPQSWGDLFACWQEEYWLPLLISDLDERTGGAFDPEGDLIEIAQWSDEIAQAIAALGLLEETGMGLNSIDPSEEWGWIIDSNGNIRGWASVPGSNTFVFTLAHRADDIAAWAPGALFIDAVEGK